MKAREAVIWAAAGLLIGAGAQKLWSHLKTSNFDDKKKYALLSKIEKIKEAVPKAKALAVQKKAENPKPKPKPLKIKQVAEKVGAPEKKEAPAQTQKPEKKKVPKFVAAEKQEAENEALVLERMGNVAEMLDGNRENLADVKAQKSENVKVAQERNILERQINIVNDLFSE